MHEIRARLADPSLWREQAFIGGQWADAGTGARLPVDDPATGRIVGTIPDCDAADTRRAIGSAHAAFPAWQRRGAIERADILMRWHELMLAHAPDLARIMTAEQGKPLAEAQGEVRYGASFLRWFSEQARLVSGGSVPAPDPSRRILLFKEPVGVCAAITPWNFPIAMITRKVGPALAAGCTMVVKPSDLTPYCALALAVLAERAGLPAGVLSVVTGRPEAIGAELTGNPIVRKISFTGSTRVGALLMRQCADTIKRLSLELGGNAPFIVFDDADLELAVAGAMASKFRNAGQTCVCANRILLQDSIHDAFAARLRQEAGKLKLGNGFEPGSTLGPLINDAAISKVEAHIADALAQGARRLAIPGEPAGTGRFVPPVILSGVTASMRIAAEETFGPVAALMRFGSEAEALAIANDTPFGLAAYFYTEDLHRTFRVGQALEFGMVGVNTGLISMAEAPFGGVKQSGLGREGGPDGIEEYLELKTFHLGSLRAAADEDSTA